MNIESDVRSSMIFRRTRQPFWRRLTPLLIIGMLLCAIVAAIFWKRVFIVVRAGEAGVYWNRFTGTRIDLVFDEGLHILNPLNRLYVYEVRKQLAYHELDVLSSEGLRIRLYLAIRFNPEYALLGMLHERIGPDYLTRVVVPQTESVLRKQLGVATAEQIYTNKDDLLTRAVLRTMEEVGRNFVEIEDVIIRRIKLPQAVKDAIEDKISQQELMRSYEFRNQTAELEAQRRRIEGIGLRDAQAIIAASLTDPLLIHESHVATMAIAEAETRTTLIMGGGGSEGGGLGVEVPIFMPHHAQLPASPVVANPLTVKAPESPH